MNRGHAQIHPAMQHQRRTQQDQAKNQEETHRHLGHGGLSNVTYVCVYAEELLS